MHRDGKIFTGSINIRIETIILINFRKDSVHLVVFRAGDNGVRGNLGGINIPSQETLGVVGLVPTSAFLFI